MLEKTMETNIIAKEVTIMIEKESLKLAYLYLLEMKDFDMILGIDWLSKNHTIIREGSFFVLGK